MEMEELSPLSEQEEKLIQLLKENKQEEAKEILSGFPTVEIAEFLSKLSLEKLLAVFKNFTAQEQAYIFTDFDADMKLSLLQYFDIPLAASLLEHMRSDDRVDLFQLLPEEMQQQFLPFFSKKVREDVLHLQSYPEESAGSVMSSDFAEIFGQMTVEEAIQKIRKDAPSKETVYYIYVVDENRHLMGFVSLKDLILSDPHTRIKAIYHDQFISARVDEDQELVAQKIEKYDLIAIPVINKDGQLLGIVTHDDALDILQQEQTEDLEKFMGIAGEHQNYAYLKMSILSHYKNRIFWLLGLAIVGVISAYIIHQFEETLSTFIILAIYLPLLIDAGGNSGGQAATVVVRALALGELTLKNWLKVVWKELRIAFLLSITLAILTFGIVTILSSSEITPAGFDLNYIAFVISLALLVQVFTATLLGSIIPLGAKKLGIDPAVIASPAITTLVDITGLLIYFSIASLLLLG